MNASNTCSQEMNRVFFFSLVFTCFVGSIIISLSHIIICACDIFMLFFFLVCGCMGNGNYSNPIGSNNKNKCLGLMYFITKDV